MTNAERELRGDMPLPAKIHDALQQAITQLREAIAACTHGRDEVMVDAVWRGDHCGPCGRKEYCAEYRDLMGEAGNNAQRPTSDSQRSTKRKVSD